LIIDIGKMVETFERPCNNRCLRPTAGNCRRFS